jgi:cytochrome c oxidase cbb3-type subunit I/II
MVRVLRAETERYGDYTRAGEHIYDRPFLWGSKRTGPDLAREGVIRPDPVWHYRHMWYPAKTTGRAPSAEDWARASIMPTYKHLFTATVDFDGIRANMRALSTPPLSTYSVAEIANGPADAKAQAARITADLVKALGDREAESEDIDADEPPAPTVESENLEIIALIAYLQRLGTDLRKGE